LTGRILKKKEYLRRKVFQQWKVFVDSEASVIVVGTTHHAVDLRRHSHTGEA
jgi:hypothetical protein